LSKGKIGGENNEESSSAGVLQLKQGCFTAIVWVKLHPPSTGLRETGLGLYKTAGNAVSTNEAKKKKSKK